jgi:hypothetical protein
VLDISHYLQPRDGVLAHLLDEHRALTTEQITAALWTSPWTCRNRLYALRRLGFIDRFIPVKPRPERIVHWVPGVLSARYVALGGEGRPPSPKALRERQDTMVSNQQLGHLDGINQFFIDLLVHARTHPGARLARWWSSATISSAIGRRVRPDGHGVWREDGREVGFFLEHDNSGIEPHSVLLGKLGPYRRLRRDGGPDYPVLFWLPSTTRENNLHHRLADLNWSGLTIATAARDNPAVARSGPAGRVWRLAGNGRHRLRLADLPSDPGEAGAYHPGPPTAKQDPLQLLGRARTS